ncbi:MAG: cupredoxin family protein [Burkholderiales bacterium]|nr:cupredoxin family protein [Burkholderiales bacterium]MDE2398742.1 cupredoxin family protein [Burkholderiales bacterium]MDE2453692.1 cupredoxin family protein [Burkholderiales bacterium]
MKKLPILCLAAAAATAPAFGHGDPAKPPRPAYDAAKVEDTAFGREGDPDRVARTIRIDMADTMRYTPSQVTVKRGETVRFVLHNRGHLLHEMVLGTAQALGEHAELMKKFPEMEHADPNMAHVKPGSSGQIVWQFSRAGRFEFACLLPGHFEAGMVGKVDVE